MVSIRKYLELRDRGPQDPATASKPQPGSVASTVSAELLCGVLDHIGAYLLAGENDAELRARLEEVRREIGEGGSAERIDHTVRTILAAHASRQHETTQRLAIETQHAVGVLNQALMALLGGRDRSVSRLRKIQDSLQRTAQIQDTNALRASLCAAVKLIEEESRREQESAERDLAAFEAEVVQVRENLFTHTIRRLPDRAEAVQALSERRAALEADSSLCVVALSVDGIGAIIQRYGPEPIEEIFFQAIRERIQPLSPNPSSWQWSRSCVVSVFVRTCGVRPGGIKELQEEVAGLSREPMVHRIKLGSRTAVLKVSLSSLALIASSLSAAETIEQLDRFAGCS